LEWWLNLEERVKDAFNWTTMIWANQMTDENKIELTAAEFSFLKEQQMLEGAPGTLAVKLVKSSVQKRNPGQDIEMLSQSVAMFSKIDGASGLLQGTANLISENAAGRQYWRVIVEQNQNVIAEVAVSCQLQDLAVQEATESVPNTEKVSTEPAETKVGKRGTLELRRRQIFEGACKVIASKGFGNASMREIAKEAGMSVPLMYKYIKDKDDILYLITSECMSDIIDYFDQLTGFSGTPGENLSHAIEKYIDYIGENRRYINLVYSETRALNAEYRAKVFSMERKFLNYWKRLVSDGVSKGAFKQLDPDLTANYIYFLCTVWSLRYWSIDYAEEETVKRSLTDFVMSAVTKE